MTHPHKEPLSLIRELQWLQLKKQLLYLQLHSPFYKKMFAKGNIDISTINTLTDFRKLSLTTKEDLQEFNEEFICVPRG